MDDKSAEAKNNKSSDHKEYIQMFKTIAKLVHSAKSNCDNKSQLPVLSLSAVFIIAASIAVF